MEAPLIQRHGQLVDNAGSNARDFCMLERNFLSHVKLAMLLSLLSFSILLRARLVPDPDQPEMHEPHSLAPGSWSMAGLQVGAAIAAIASGYWEYRTGCRDLETMRAFMTYYTVKPHLAVMTIVIFVVVATCLIMLADEKLL